MITYYIDVDMICDRCEAKKSYRAVPVTNTQNWSVLEKIKELYADGDMELYYWKVNSDGVYCMSCVNEWETATS